MVGPIVTPHLVRCLGGLFGRGRSRAAGGACAGADGRCVTPRRPSKILGRKAGSGGGGGPAAGAAVLPVPGSEDIHRPAGPRSEGYEVGPRPATGPERRGRGRPRKEADE
jgi:hypothetical protein